MDNQPPQLQPQPLPPIAPPIPPTPPETSKSPTPQETKQELRDAITGSNQVLVRATTKLTPFPDTLTVDRTLVTVTKRTFFQVAEVMSIRIEDILNVTATVGPFFGTLKIVSRVMNTDSPAFKVGRFSRNDALKVKYIIQGYVVALQRGIDCNALSTNELSSMLERLGKDDH